RLTGVGQQLLDVDAHDGRGQKTEERERAVAPSDVGRIVEHAAEGPLARELVHRGPGIGDGDELPPGLGAGELLDLRVEIVEEAVWLDRGAGFARDDEERLGQVEPA